LTETFRFYDYDVPEHLAVLTGAGGSTFKLVSDEQLDVLQKHIGVNRDHAVLEIGCGIGRAAIPFTHLLSPSGRYIGIDIVRESIDWCNANIAASSGDVPVRHPNFSFLCLDVQSHMYNPNGAMTAAELRLPVDDRSIDRIFLFSVFTHMFEPDIRGYLAEFARVLKPSGLALATWFMIDEDNLKSVREFGSVMGEHIRFAHRISMSCWVSDIHHPLGAVGYSEPAIHDMVASAGLRVINAVRGYWSRVYPNIGQGGQDITVLAPV